MLICGFNEAHNNIDASSMEVGDESMSDISSRTTAKGNLPHLSNTFRKPEPLGADFNKFICYVLGALIFIELKRGKDGKKHRNHQKKLGDNAACTKRIMEGTEGIGQRYRKGALKHCFLFCSWLSSNNSTEALMEVGAELIGMVKRNTKGLFKGTIDNFTKDWPGGSYLILRSNPMIPGGQATNRYWLQV